MKASLTIAALTLAALSGTTIAYPVSPPPALPHSALEYGPAQPTAQPLGQASATVAQPTAKPRPTPRKPVRFASPEGAGMPAWKKQVLADIRATWGGGEKAEIAAAIAYSEHGFNCEGNGPDWGVFQLHERRIEDCMENIQVAYREYYLPRGFRPWSDYNNGKYLRYLSFAQ